jgi:hypothetical protein
MKLVASVLLLMFDVGGNNVIITIIIINIISKEFKSSISND